MRVLFLDQSGNLGGAELSLADVVKPYGDRCLVTLFTDGPFRTLLEQQQTPVQVLQSQLTQVHKDSSLPQSICSIGALIPLVRAVATLADDYDLIYANTQKALVIGALASILSRRPLVYHLRDILSAQHFSRTNRFIATTFANLFARLVIANSKATKNAFIEVGGRADITHVVYNGFIPENYKAASSHISQAKQELNWKNHFIVGHFSRLSPWKGQHILLEALVHCPEHIVAVFVGDALFGEHEYVRFLHQRVVALGLEERVRFLGFRFDVAPLMSACDLVVHTSTAPEPFGRVIIEAMLCHRPVVAADAAGAVEIVKHGETGWLSPPGDATQLARLITTIQRQPEQTQEIIREAQLRANQLFNLKQTNQHIFQLLQSIV